MRSQKYQKIDLDNDYPCPCRRRGRLLPIILTEALGCNLCQQIFVVQENNHVIEQLSSHYPYKRSWRWTGYRWLPSHHRFGEGLLPITLGIILFLLIVWLPLILKAPSSLSIIFWAIMAMLLVVLPAVIFWLAYRR